MPDFVGEPVDLSAELDTMIEDARVLATDSRLQFDVEIQSQLRVDGDRALLHTAIFNHIINAIKYTTDGKIAIRGGEQNSFSIGNTLMKPKSRAG